ncbi:MAG: protein kinase domain-containing protein, partial [Planctomycetota bacterium]
MDADPTVAWKPGDGDDGRSGARDASRRLDPLLGREFGGVRIERILGSGGMGRVYLGTDAASGERVAIKVLLRTQQDEGVRRRFEREGRLLERLRHPGIASVLRTGVVQDGDVDVPYIVMEHVDGVQNLADHVFRERLGVRETVQAFLQACDAVGHAHREGFIHRDVKPPNLLVDR